MANHLVAMTTSRKQLCFNNQAFNVFETEPFLLYSLEQLFKQLRNTTLFTVSHLIKS